MEPCVFCRRRSVRFTQQGPLCAACSQDALDDDRWGSPSATAEDCTGDNGCLCAECTILDAFLARP